MLDMAIASTTGSLGALSVGVLAVGAAAPVTALVGLGLVIGACVKGMLD